MDPMTMMALGSIAQGVGTAAAGAPSGSMLDVGAVSIIPTMGAPFAVGSGASSDARNSPSASAGGGGGSSLPAWERALPWVAGMVVAIVLLKRL